MDSQDFIRGSLFADRFELDGLVGGGGMGAVYRARDRSSGDWVALKLLQLPTRDAAATVRFFREAQLLSELRHPGIVSYVAHGQAPSGQSFLAMEWLNGEDLGERLARGPLPTLACAALMEQIAAALAVAHQRGVIHRDLKPENIMMVPDSVMPTGERAKLIDFGIARELRAGQPLTRTGDVLGTPEYMAPEQARGEADIGPSADIFSLGCILYHCLTGQPAFAGEHPVAVIGKILFGDPPDVAALWAENPPLGELVARMLSKDPAQRPRDAGVLHQEILALMPLLHAPSEALPKPRLPRTGLTSTEQRLLSIIVARLPDPEQSAELVTVRAALAALGVKVEYLPGHRLLATVARVSSAQDQALLAAKSALLLRERYPRAQIAVTTGRGLLAARQSAQGSDAIERAVQMAEARGHDRTDAAGQILLDEVTAGLLGPGFAQAATAEGAILLLGEAENADETRQLLGKPTPCVGREQELLMLAALLRHSISEARAQAVLVVAPPGMGKSRLRHEFLARTRSQGTDMLILSGRASPLGVGSPYSTLAQALRGWCGAQRGEDLAVQRAKLQSRIAECVPVADAERISAFLGELCGIPFSDACSVALLAARSNPQLMHEQIRRAVIDFIRAECLRHPLLLVLDDLHWADSLSINLVDAVLRALPEQPLMVLALARPELKERIPSLWSSYVQEIPLQGLGKRAAERLCRQILGEHAAPPLLERIIERAAGNALFLEELIRALGEGHDAALPETIMAMLQARLLRLDAMARRALRAASVLGETFWRGGVLDLLGIETTNTDCDMVLQRLAAAEVIEPRAACRYMGEREYRFRHGLVRDAAYSLLTDEDRRTGHQLAGRYLERVGETEALLIAEHFHAASLPAQALPFFIRAGEQSLERYDSDGTLRRVERGIVCGAAGQELGVLRSLELNALFGMGRWQDLASTCREATKHLSRGSKFWCRSITVAGNLASIGEFDLFLEFSQQLSEAELAPDAAIEYLNALANYVRFLSAFGIRTHAHRCLERMLTTAAPYMAKNPIVRNACTQAHSYYIRFLGADPWAVYTLSREAVAAGEQLENLRWLVFALGELGSSTMELGSWDHAEPQLRRAKALAQRLAEPYYCSYASGALLLNLIRSGEPANREEANALVAEVLPVFAGNALLEGTVRMFAGHGADASGRLDEAELHLRRAVDLLQSGPAQQILAIAYLIAVLLEKQQVAEAYALACQGLRALAVMGESGDNLIRFLIAAAEAHWAQGQIEPALKLLARACYQIDLRANRIPDPTWRTRFLALPENLRAAELRRQWPQAC